MNENKKLIRIAGSVLDVRERSFKDKEGTTRKVKEVKFLSEDGDLIVFGYNNFHDEFDFDACAALARQDVHLLFELSGAEDYFYRPVITVHSVVKRGS